MVKIRTVLTEMKRGEKRSSTVATDVITKHSRPGFPQESTADMAEE